MLAALISVGQTAPRTASSHSSLAESVEVAHERVEDGDHDGPTSCP